MLLLADVLPDTPTGWGAVASSIVMGILWARSEWKKSATVEQAAQAAEEKRLAEIRIEDEKRRCEGLDYTIKTYRQLHEDCQQRFREYVEDMDKWVKQAREGEREMQEEKIVLERENATLRAVLSIKGKKMPLPDSSEGEKSE